MNILYPSHSARRILSKNLMLTAGLLVFLFLGAPLNQARAEDDPPPPEAPSLPDKTPKKQAQANETSGALIHSYTIDIPPGRNNIQPDLQLYYNSQTIDKESPFGQGWALSIPSIERLNKKGITTLYSDNYFSSSLDGELVSTGTGTYGAKVENGSFLSYSYSSNVWTVKDKSGTLYTYGATAASRQDDPSDSSRIVKWMLTEIRDTNDNFITYTYYKNGGQIYPDTITYTGHGSTAGIFQVVFNRESRPDVTTSYRTGFLVTTSYRINNITISVDSSWVTKYDIVYQAGDNGSTSLLHTITKSGRAEDTSVTTLPPTTFDYQSTTSSTYHWTDSTTTEWDSPRYLSYFYGTFSLDINGDGYDDFIQAVQHPNNQEDKKVFLSDGHGNWTEATGYALPFYFVSYDSNNNRSIDKGKRFIDLNGDNLVDITSSGQGGYINTGSGWSSQDMAWNAPLDFQQYNDWIPPAYLANLNGDNLPDIIQARQLTLEDESTTIQTLVYINNGHGWTEETDWTAPQQINSTYGSMIVDVNGDGLDDILESAIDNNGPYKKAYLNTGNKTWVESSAYEPPVIFVSRPNGPFDYGARFVDINGDGLLDILQSSFHYSGHAFLNTGTGWQEVIQWAPPGPFVPHYAHDIYNTPFNISSITGSILPNIWQAKEYWNGTQDVIRTTVYKNNDKKANELKKITYPTGGTTTITYTPTTLYKNGTTLLNPGLPLKLDTVSQIVEDDGVNPVVTTTYTYEGGSYYYDTYLENQFAGFAKVTTNNGLTRIKSFYHQGNSSDSSHGEYNDHASKIGKKYREEIRDTSGNLYSVMINKWDKADIGNGRNFVKLAQTLDMTYDGNSSHKDKATGYTYSDTTGNTTVITTYGVVTGSDDGTFTDTGSDKYTTSLSYVSNTTAGIIGLPSQETITNQASTMVKDTLYYYDGQSLGNVTVGNQTKQELWKAVGDPYSSYQKAYNSYGLVTSETDPRNYVSTYAYDTYNLYPASVTNPLDHETTYTYDYSSGLIKNTIDANGNTYTTTYDGLDRPLEQKIPDVNGSGQVTKTSYEYTDTANAVKVKGSQHLDSSNVVDFYTYFDGLNRKLQERIEAATATQYIVRDFAYNAYGLLAKESLPYFSNGSARTTATTNSALYTTFTYDPLKRVTAATTTVGTTSTVFDDWKTTITDPESKVKDIYKDAYDNIIQVGEHKDSSTYTTSYEYNVLHKLTKLTDALGNVRNFIYDGVGNVISAEDLHATADTTFGTWSYYYDYSSNLTSRTDPNSQTVTFTYDGINRVFTENYTGASGTEVTYAYDTCTEGVGKLCEASNATSTKEYTYDNQGNIITEEVTIGSNNFTTSYTYDRQGNRLLITNPDSSQVKYLYDNGGLVTQIQHKESSDSGFTDIISSISYNPVSLITSITYGNGSSTTNTYDDDELYRLRHRVTTADSEAAQDLTYTYDAVGNIEQIVDASDTDTAKTTDYTYDDLHRLASSEISEAENAALDGPNGEMATQGFEYDEIGNVLYNPERGEYYYEGNQGSSYANPHAVTATADGHEYIYDHNGNVLSDDNNTYTWDYNNRLLEVENEAGSFLYSYDTTGQRMKAETPSDTFYYPTTFYSATDTDPEKHIFLNDTAVATVRGSNTSAEIFTIHADHLTGSNVVTDDTEAMSQIIDYYAFGSLRLDQRLGDYNEKRKFTGHEFDDETGLTYANARYYDPKFGRWISQDPIFVNFSNEMMIEKNANEKYDKFLTNPQTFNAYSYVANNPLKYIDLTGLFNSDNGIIEEGDTQKIIMEAINSKWNTNYTWSQIVGLNNDVLSNPDINLKTLVGKTIIPNKATPDVTMDLTAKMHFYAADSSMSNPIHFLSKVKNKGELDLKNQKDTVYYKGNNIEAYVYNAQKIDKDAPGNILYGYVGSRAGYSNVTLHLGAGYAQIMSGTSKWSWITSRNFGDDPHDASYINYGIYLNKVGK